MDNETRGLMAELMYSGDAFDFCLGLFMGLSLIRGLQLFLMGVLF